MNPKKHFIIRNPMSRFKISGDQDMFNLIVRDMMENGGELSPSNHWNWNLGQSGEQEKQKVEGYTESLYDENYCELELMLKPMVGVNGMEPIKKETIEKYESFLRLIDHLSILPTDILSFGLSNDWRETDLGSIMDVNLIAGYIDKHHRCQRLKVCEVGGGYGRLAEAITNVLNQPIHYVLMDAVPASLMYTHMYLRQQLPDAKIGSFYAGNTYSEDFDIYIMPAWHEKRLHSSYFDICINIESMQEMEQHHVNHYLLLFDRLTVDKGIIYLSNARDYVFSDDWHIPAHWETVFLNNTPRSWTADHPTHILRKGAGDFSTERSLLEGAFHQQISAWRDHQTIQVLKRNIEDRDRICHELQQEINRLSSVPE